ECHRDRGSSCALLAGLPLPLVGAGVLNADDARLRPSELPPDRAPHESLSNSVDASVEVVGGEESKVSAVVAVTLDHVVLVTRHVLLVAGEDDEVVALREFVPARQAVEVVVGKEVDRLPGAVEPRDELEVPVVEAKGDAEVEEGTAQIHAPVASGDVPRIAPAIPVGIREVVRRPGVRREDDGDAVGSKTPRPDDERWV